MFRFVVFKHDIASHYLEITFEVQDDSNFKLVGA